MSWDAGPSASTYVSSSPREAEGGVNQLRAAFSLL